ncbi:MAG TPA: FtsQ-type POTRA domain-containing protein [Thermoanaerobaculia bacterium]|nr:FtsQ-type POTRA domain-containing protein [Thermoanaerobaculia bacterium]
MSVAPVLPTPEEFRRSGAPPRRRRRNPIVALLRPLAVSLLLVALPAALVTWVLASPRFDLAEVIVVAGTPRIPAEALRAAIAPFEGGNLVLLPLGSVEAAVRRNPWVDTVEVAKELPDRLRVGVTERKPVALLEKAGGLVYADEKGRPIAPVEDPEQARRTGLVVVVFTHPQLSPSDGVGGALEVAGELGRVQPSWAGALSKIEVLGEQDFRLHTAALRFPLLVTRGQVGPKVKRLKELLPELDRRYPAIQAVDLRFSRRIVVQPAAPDPQRSGPELRS